VVKDPQPARPSNGAARVGLRLVHLVRLVVTSKLTYGTGMVVSGLFQLRSSPGNAFLLLVAGCGFAWWWHNDRSKSRADAARRAGEDRHRAEPLGADASQAPAAEPRDPER
jgi:hypothetical protein